MPFPRQAPSWYHWSKVHGSNNLMFASRIWGLRVTDVMQGIVFGCAFPGQPDAAPLRTRFDFDQCFGTVINRFCCQAVIGHPLTPYGTGGQKRGFLPLADSLQCLSLAIANPPAAAEYRVFNQFQEVHEIAHLARQVQSAAADAGLRADIQPLPNPRIEMEDHYYHPDHQHLFDLGYRPSCDIDSQLRQMIATLLPHRRRIDAHRDALLPDIRWNGTRAEAAGAGLGRYRHAGS
jgi:UDP-sulfoquinovose synthase